MRYRIKDIENFAASARCTTMGEAARMLGISQPSLSESMQRLESDLLSPVFYRSRSGIQLTPRGRLFLTKVNGLLSSIQNLEMQKEPDVVFGGQTISIGCHPTVASYTLPKALASLRKTAPDFRVELHHDLSRLIQAQVQRGRIDIGVVVNPVRVPDLVVAKLGMDKVAVWSRDHGPIDDTLIYNPQLLQSQAILKKWKNSPSRTIETEGLDLICRLVAQGLGYGIIPTKAVELSGERLKQVKSMPTYSDEIALLYRPEFGRSPSERAVIDAIRSAF